MIYATLPSVVTRVAMLMLKREAIYCVPEIRVTYTTTISLRKIKCFTA